MDAFNIFKDPTPTEELVGKHKAARFDITGIPGTPENLDVVLWTVQVEGLIAYAQVSTARGEMADFEPTVKTILSSLRFESISPTADGPASLGGKILFVSQRDGNLELYSMNADGSQQKRLTNTKQNEQCADWSPDGSQIVYSRTDDFQIYTMAADGSRQKKISSGNNITSNPSYSPDGKRIAYASLQRSGNTVKQANIRLVNANGSNGKDLIPKSDFLFVSDPEWTADGTTILFVASKQASGKAFLYTINVDGTGLKQLFSQSVSTKASPRWSPDGSQILFHVEQDNGNLAVYVVNADGTNSRRVTPGHYNNRNTVWAPDGKHLLVMSNRDGFFKLYLIDLDGKFVSQLTHSIYDGCPAWWFDNTQEAAK
jgi:Tol biopolymer transport system component